MFILQSEWTHKKADFRSYAVPLAISFNVTLKGVCENVIQKLWFIQPNYMITTQAILYISIFQKRNIKSIVDLQHSSSSKDLENWSGCWSGIFNCTVDQECSEFTIQNNNYWYTTTRRNTQQQASQHEEQLQTCGISELPTVNSWSRMRITFLSSISFNLSYCQMF